MSDRERTTNPVTAVTSAWTRFAETAFKSTTAANRAAVDAMTDRSDDGSGDGASEVETADGEGRVELALDAAKSPIESIAYEGADWIVERSVDRVDEISVGDTVRFERAIDGDDVRAFAAASGDTNRLHLDEQFAERARFGTPIVHGTHGAGLISAALARLPGSTIYLSQSLEFRAPIHVGDRVSATVEVVEALEDRQFRLSTVVYNETDDAVVIDGTAVVLVDDLPESD